MATTMAIPPGSSSSLYQGSRFFEGSHNFSIGSAVMTGGDLHIHYSSTQEGMIDEVNKIANWLPGSMNYWPYHEDLRSRRTAGTGVWFLQSKQLRGWLGGEFTTLWVTGIPGAGKSMLASFSVDLAYPTPDAKSNSKTAVVFVYCRYMDGCTAKGIISTFVRQLLEANPFVYGILKPTFEKARTRQSELGMEDVLGILRSILAHFDKTQAVIDGLDEVTDDEKAVLLEALSGLQLDLLIFSRPLELFVDMLLAPTIMSVEAQEQDVRRFAREAIQGSPRLRKLLRGKESLIEDITANVTENSGGMFLLAALQVEAIKGSLNMKALLSVLKTLPSSVNDMYARTLDRINRQAEDEASLARMALMWLTHAARPLSMVELQHALATSYEDGTFDPDAIVPAEIILSACCGLVVCGPNIVDDDDDYSTGSEESDEEDASEEDNSDENSSEGGGSDSNPSEDGTPEDDDDDLEDESDDSDTEDLEEDDEREVRLIHYTTLEYLKALDHSPFSDHSSITTLSCIAYLKHHLSSLTTLPPGRCIKCSMDFSSILFKRSSIDGWCMSFADPFKEFIDSSPLFTDYAHQYLGVHAQGLVAEREPEKKVLATLADFLSDCDGFPVTFPDQAAFDIISPFSFAAHYAIRDLLPLVEHNDRPSRYHSDTALHLAVRSGDEEMVKLLLQDDSLDPDAQNVSWDTPLSLAIDSRLHSVLTVLLDHPSIGIHISASSWRRGFRKNKGFDGLVTKVVAHRRFDTRWRDIHGNTAIHYSCLHNRNPDQKCPPGILKFLLSREGFDVNATNNRGDTPLMLALGCNFEKARKVWLLLAHTDTNPNIPNSYGLTPLSKVRQNIDLLCFRYLLSNPLLKVDFVDGESSPSIWRGSSRDYTDDDLIHLLMLDPDFDLNRPGATGSNALHVAIQSDCSASTVAALLAAAEGSVDINMKNRQERTPLMLAMTSRIEREQKIGVLLSQPDLDPNIREEIEDHGAVLHKAVKSGDPAICRLLLSHSLTDVNLKDSKKNTPLMLALNNCHSSKSAQYTEIVQMLCAHETIDINAPLLHAFSSPTSTFACGLLLAQEGIDVNARSVYFGRTALMMSIDLPAESAEAKVRMLLSVPRVDANLCDCYKEPPLSKAIKNGSGAVCRLLLSHPSIDVNLRDSQGFTPLMHACRGAHQESNLEVIWLLLSRPGLEVNIRSYSGLTALMIACRNNFRLAAKFLMDRDDVDIRVDEVDAGE